ncbi:MAG: hypothetical protein ACOYB3_01310 [Azonexus sp.]
MAKDSLISSVPPEILAAAKAANQRPWLKQVLEEAKKARVMDRCLDQLSSDLRSGVMLIPINRIESLYRKFKAKPCTGNRVWWYYDDDKKFAKGEDISVRSIAGYSGILVPGIDVETTCDYDIEKLVVVQDRYPCEKCNPESQWISLIRLLLSPGLVEVFDK